MLLNFLARLFAYYATLSVLPQAEGYFCWA